MPGLMDFVGDPCADAGITGQFLRRVDPSEIVRRSALVAPEQAIRNDSVNDDPAPAEASCLLRGAASEVAILHANSFGCVAMAASSLLAQLRWNSALLFPAQRRISAITSRTAARSMGGEVYRSTPLPGYLPGRNTTFMLGVVNATGSPIPARCRAIASRQAMSWSAVGNLPAPSITPDCSNTSSSVIVMTALPAAGRRRS